MNVPNFGSPGLDRDPLDSTLRLPHIHCTSQQIKKRPIMGWVSNLAKWLG